MNGQQCNRPLPIPIDDKHKVYTMASRRTRPSRLLNEEAFAQTPGMQALVHNRLRTLRVTMDATFEDFGEDMTPTFAERGE